jgi:hypothetical protein
MRQEYGLEGYTVMEGAGRFRRIYSLCHQDWKVKQKRKQKMQQPSYCAVIRCGLVDGYHCFGGTSYFLLQCISTENLREQYKYFHGTIVTQQEGIFR